MCQSRLSCDCSSIIKAVLVVVVSSIRKDLKKCHVEVECEHSVANFDYLFYGQMIIEKEKKLEVKIGLAFLSLLFFIVTLERCEL